jgi:hypothetical protein
MSACYPVPLHHYRTHVYVRQQNGMRTHRNSLKINDIQTSFNAERNNEEKTLQQFNFMPVSKTELRNY